MKRLFGYVLLGIAFGLRCIHNVLHPADVAYWLEDKVICKLLGHAWEDRKDATEFEGEDGPKCWLYCKRCSERKDCDAG